MRVVTQLEKTAWKTFVDDNPHGNIFHTPEMFQVLARTEGYRPTLWATLSDDGEVLALLTPVQITLQDGFLRSLTTRAVAYGSILAAPGEEGAVALAQLLDAYLHQVKGFLFTELRNLSDLTAIQPILQQYGFAYEDHLNYLVNLERSAEQVMQDISSRTRSYIRRALRENSLEIREVSSRSEMQSCYELLRKTYQNARVPLAPRSLFDNLIDILGPKKMLRVVMAYVEDRPVAASVDLLYKDMIYYWYGGMDRAYGREHPNELLRWNVLEWGINNGFRLFDFGGAGKPDEDYGVRDFKSKFGGELVGYGRNVYAHSPRLLRLSTFSYNVLRRFL